MTYFLSYALWAILIAGWAASILLAFYVWCLKRDQKSVALDRDHYKRLLSMSDTDDEMKLDDIILEASYPRRKPVGYTFQDGSD